MTILPLPPRPESEETVPTPSHWNPPVTHDLGANSNTAAGAVIRLLAHELRQPLSSIHSIAYYLTLTLESATPQTRDQLAKLQQLVMEANQIIADATAGFEGVRLVCQAVDLESMLERKIERRPDSQRARLEFTRSSGDAVFADPAQLSRLLDSLLSLALNLATEGSRLELRTSRLIEGVGLELNFAPAHCSASDLLPRCDGSVPTVGSFALAAAQRIIASHGGQLWATQERGRISLWISLPLATNR